ncbi:MAG TPA: hypothetical protein VH593_02305 [Ktedonobacteraceae bacterium]|jgi:hypothetical protein
MILYKKTFPQDDARIGRQASINRTGEVGRINEIVLYDNDPDESIHIVGPSGVGCGGLSASEITIRRRCGVSA